MEGRLLYAGRNWRSLDAHDVFAAIWVEFRDECRLKNIDPEKVLDDWLIEEDMLEAAAKMSGGRESGPRRDGERSWGENDRVALSLLAAMKD